ncbi:Protein of unknown function [Actinacidiphila yanglinensis]|uniref:DUF742 domain-containing protein n=1 Tax=Actinacidiphila yanglinensis TaxID=310779 RepID=A0A1H6E6B0_9ACTN|nr:DUF742 domain-containing protein [Actinacidiphila yanglinensis]SEG92494.1 Protein of unknown function [Actinacidiphila yanglinensis]
MSTSPGGDPYGNPHQQPANPYTYPSAPDPEQQPGQPGSPYRQPRIQPYAPPQAPPPQGPVPGQEQHGHGRHQGTYGRPPSQGQGGPGSQGSQAGQGYDQGQGRNAGGRSRTPSGLVRPYAMTGGRTRPRYQLAIEALVSTSADPERLRGQLPEHQRICLLCREVKSVAEISALLTIPLGVVRILVADLAEAGLVAIHQPGGDESAGGQPDVTLLERVLSGLRKL